MAFRDQWYAVSRISGLRRFAFAITAFNVLGHLVFGFEQSVAQPFVALAVTYSMALLLEAVSAWQVRREPAFKGGIVSLVDFLLPAHITGLAVAMLLYANDRLWPIALAAAVAMGSKYIFTVRRDGRSRHYFNPSNIGIASVLVLFPSVGIAPPYHFTENFSGAADWILPALIVISGTYLNATITRRMPLLGAWLGAFFLQAVVRNLIFGTSVIAGLVPMTGVAFVLYTFYMVTDPATTPGRTRDQIWFGLSVGFAYGLLMLIHVVFGLFFALAAVCAVRGIKLHAQAWAQRRALQAELTAAEVANADGVAVAA